MCDSQVHIICIRKDHIKIYGLSVLIFPSSGNLIHKTNVILRLILNEVSLSLSEI